MRAWLFFLEICVGELGPGGSNSNASVSYLSAHRDGNTRFMHFDGGLNTQMLGLIHVRSNDKM